MNQGAKDDLSELLLGVAEQGFIGGVAPLKAPLPVRDGDPRSGVLEHLAEALGALAQHLLRLLAVFDFSPQLFQMAYALSELLCNASHFALPRASEHLR